MQGKGGKNGARQNFVHDVISNTMQNLKDIRLLGYSSGERYAALWKLSSTNSQLAR
jgi:hypothetical protein